MVRNCALYLLLITLPLSLFSATFTASVNRKKISFGKSFILVLELADASAKESPDISVLKKSFIIHGQQQSSSTKIVNGKMSSSTSWQLNLIPQKDGTIVIPSISLKTSEGVLLSDPIQIHVVKGASDSDSANDTGITLTATASKAKIYKNEPFSYTIKLVSRESLANVSMQKLTIEDAVVETVEEPTVEEKMIDGIHYQIIELSFLITPLKAGSLIIPPTLIQGAIPSKRRPRIKSFFDDEFNPFQMLRNFDRLEPFALWTDKTILEVQPPVSGVSPWLPLISLEVEEEWDQSQTLKVGEPLTRGFRIIAKGGKASQLPSLSDRQLHDESFKIYADKPELKDIFENGVIRSYREERYTLIPQEAGTLTLPEISISWWDVTKEAMAYARVPSKTLKVSPVPSAVQTSERTSSLTTTSEEPANSRLVIRQNNPMLYILIAGLVIVLLLGFFWIISLQRKIFSLRDVPVKEVAKNPKKALPVHLKELESVSTLEEFKSFLQRYAKNHWHVPRNAPLSIVFEVVKKRSPKNLHQEISSIEKFLKDALYRNKQIDINDMIKRCSVVLQQTKQADSRVVKNEKLPDLNPT